jgi:hypothetical protein
MLIHDSFSSVGVTAALVRLLFGGGGFRYVGRVGSLAEYRAQAPHGAGERVMNAARQVRELGWFARNVAIKVAITARLRRVARALGSETWPY